MRGHAERQGTDLGRKFFDRVLTEAIGEGLVSEDHFTIDGTLIRSMASLKSLERIDDDERDDDPSGGRDQLVNWRGERRSNATHRSKTDPEARLARKGWGKEAHLSHSVRKRIEQIIGWMKITGTQARTRFVDRGRIELDAQMTAAAYNLLRITRLLVPT